MLGYWYFDSFDLCLQKLFKTESVYVGIAYKLFCGSHGHMLLSTDWYLWLTEKTDSEKYYALP